MQKPKFNVGDENPLKSQLIFSFWSVSHYSDEPFWKTIWKTKSKSEIND